jgi:DNA modification methylase
VDYAYIHEPILYAWKPGAGHKFYGDFQTSVLPFDRPMQSKSHPTEKPVDLFMRLIENSTLPNQIVFDPFLGSGTTLLACRRTNRIGCGFEINPQYLEVIEKRYMEKVPNIETFGGD